MHTACRWAGRHEADVKLLGLLAKSWPNKGLQPTAYSGG